MAMYFNTNILLLAFFAITGILFSDNNNNMVVGDDCQGDMQGLVAQCAMYVQKSLPKMNPSQQCCSVIQKADMPCVCQHVTKDVEKIIDMEKVIFVAQYCGRPVAPGTTCGSKKLLCGVWYGGIHITPGIQIPRNVAIPMFGFIGRFLGM